MVGQPEFLESMTVFLDKTSTSSVLVVDLSQSLCQYPPIGYFRKDKPVSRPYRCTRTNENTLELCLDTMSLFKSKTKWSPTKLLILGTHRDILFTHDTADGRAKLKKSPLKSEKQYIFFDTSALIFEINALNEDDSLNMTASKIQSYVVDKYPQKVVEMPRRWHKFDQMLRKEGHDHKSKVMSYHHCWQIAKIQLGLNEASFNSALDFFHSVGIMLYFRSILPKVVFLEPQVILEKVAELVEFMFELQELEHQEMLSSNPTIVMCASDSNKLLHGELPHSSNPPDWEQFKMFGYVTKQFLGDKRFSSHYRDKLFTEIDLGHLLEQLLVFCELSSDPYNNTWIMPTLLGKVPKEKIGEDVMSSNPLTVPLPKDRPNYGAFCSLICHLLSPQNCCLHQWQLCMTPEGPACLYRNCVKFQLECCSVTLFDRYDRLEVFISEEGMQEVVKKALCNGIEIVCNTLGYTVANSYVSESPLGKCVLFVFCINADCTNYD